MKNFLKISQEEKKYILEKYSLLTEDDKYGCIKGDCKNGYGEFRYENTKNKPVYCEYYKGNYELCCN